MNSVACVTKVLERIVENMNSFEEGQNITPVIDSVCDIGCYALKKSLHCSLLRNVFLILKKFHHHAANSNAASQFLDIVNQFYKTRNLGSDLKCVLLSYFPPAAETEVLTLLNICATICDIDDLPRLKMAVTESGLPSACVENLDLLYKINCILKQTFTVTEGNPVVGYLSFVFNQAVKDASKPCKDVRLFPNEFCHLEILFSLPQEFICKQQQIHYVGHLLSVLVNAVEIHICDEADILFLCAVFPSLHHQAMTCFINETFDAFKFLRILYNFDKELKSGVITILGNSIWKYLLES